MTTFYLVRHGEAQWDIARERNLRGWGGDLVPLTTMGVKQIELTGNALRHRFPQLVISSPMTRALNSAAILSRLLDLPLQVEFDLHEWIPDTSFSWNDRSQVLESATDMRQWRGEWPQGAEKNWEPLSAVSNRVVRVLHRYEHFDKVIAVCHEVIIYALTGKEAKPGEFYKYHSSSTPFHLRKGQNVRSHHQRKTN